MILLRKIPIVFTNLNFYLLFFVCIYGVGVWDVHLLWHTDEGQKIMWGSHPLLPYCDRVLYHRG